MFFDDAIKCRLQHDNGQTDEADFGDMKPEGENKNDSGNRLNNKSGVVAVSSLRSFRGIEFDQNFPYTLWQ